MIIHKNLKLSTPIGNSVVTMGSFDGVHKGHSLILEKVVKVANSNNLESVLITFSHHPRKVLQKQTESIKLLTTPEERQAIFEKIGIKHLMCVTFTPELAVVEAETFIKDVFINLLNAKYIITGYGHRFGKGGKGDHQMLEQSAPIYGYQAELIPMQDIEQNMISSTKIRDFLLLGNIEEAYKYLGYYYQLSGVVTGGSRIGNTIGFPTANIGDIHPEKLIPGDGVYAVTAILDGITHKGMMNIGFRPTVNGIFRTLEVHLFDFQGNAYGKPITVFFNHRLRPEMKFNSLEELTNQLKKDRDIARKLFGI